MWLVVTRDAIASHRVRRYLAPSYVYVAVLHVLALLEIRTANIFVPKPRKVSRKTPTQICAYATAFHLQTITRFH